QLKDNGEQNLSGATVTSTGGTVTVNPDGSFKVTALTPGTFIISYTSPLPRGFILVYPKNGPPPSFAVTVGSGCRVDTGTGASCDNLQNVNNLNFAISNSIPWIQTYD